MDEATVIGYVISAIITLGGFVAVIMKFVQPINDLRIVIQKLNDAIDTLKCDNQNQTKRIDKHDEQIDDLDRRVDKIETKIEMYHKDSPS
jgi:peptidoglycan hydrolase CwlO-like protein